MEVLYPRCAGLDVHSRRVNGCVRVATGRKATTEHREFATTTAGLLELAAWLSEAGRTRVAMGGDRRVLEAGVAHSRRVVHAGARQCPTHPERSRPQERPQRRGLDRRLVGARLIRGSFVPPTPIQELRDLTRTRKQLVGEIFRHTLRLQQTLEDANVKLTRVVRDILGVNGRAILAAIIAGETDPERLADCTKRAAEGRSCGDRRRGARPCDVASSLLAESCTWRRSTR